MLVYKITNLVNGKVYIGITTKTLKERKRNHLSKFNSGYRNRLYNAFEKYGVDKFEWVIIDTAMCKQELYEKEILYVSMYDSMQNGYNCTGGGDKNPMDYEDVRNKHLKAMQDEEFKKRASEITKNLWLNEEFKSKTLRRIRENSKKESYINKQRIASTGRLHTEDDLKKMRESNPNKKMVVMIKNNLVIKTFKSLGDASRYVFDNLDVKASSAKNVKTMIGNCCRGKYSTAYGCEWEYLTNESVETIEPHVAG